MDHHRKAPISPEIALANDVFDQLCAASTFKSILCHYRHLCELLHVKPTYFPLFYPKLKAKLRSWKAQALWNKFDKKSTHKCYNRGKACPNTRVLIIGAGPCGLRAAIEAQLLGAKVVVVEKRDRMSRNNVLHLWPFVIQDLRALGAKKFFGKFCAGSIDHISIRQLQCILLKVALIFGVEIHEGVSFEGLIPPPDDQSDAKGWHANVLPSDHPASQYEFDVLIGADGKRNTLEGFKRKEFRGKLAIAITANFINKKTEAEARVEEISGVAFIFNQKFFKDLYSETGIDLENIVYYKDDTHYFVMTAKKHSLLDKGVIMNDYADTARLLSLDNVDRTALMEYAREAADFSTNYKLPHLEFAVNHYGQPDVAMFDFTSMYAAENASRIIEKNGHRLLMTLVGDSLLEPFWPTGSGCARGFLSSMDACWAARSWGMGQNPLEVLSERESIYRILGQTTPENLHRDYGSYTLDPHTRYPNLNIRAVLPIQARGLYTSDNPNAIEECLKAPTIELPKKRRRKDSQVHPETLLHWLKKQVALYESVKIEDMTSSFKDGMALCAIIHRYRPDLLDFHKLRPEDVAKNNQLAFDTLERELSIPPVMTGLEMAQCNIPDKLAMLSYLSQIYDSFRGEIPHIKHPKLEDDEMVVKKEDENSAAAMSAKLRSLTPAQRVSIIGCIASTVQTPSRKRSSLPRADNVPLVRRTRKRRSASDRERSFQNIQEEFNEHQKVREEIENNKRDRMMRRMYLRHLANQQFAKSMQMLQSNSRSDSDNAPFEDYSLFVYRQTAPDFKDRIKDLERKMNPFQAEKEAKLQAEIRKGGPDEDFSGRVKNLEAKLKGTIPTDKKPKDLNRSIGKIEKTDWNVKEIEKKIEENKMGRGVKARPEKVPKWSREQFADKFSAVERKLKARGTDSAGNKYADIDTSLKRLEQKIKEGSVLEQGRNKVSAMAAQLANKNQQELEKPQIQKSGSKAVLTLPAQGGSEICHFCNKRVYLMERLSAEGKFFHRGCFRCEYCSTTLRLGSYAFDRDGKYGSKFFCTNHFGFQGSQRMRARRAEELAKMGKENIPKTPQAAKISQHLQDVEMDALDRGTTPERVEFENLSGLGISDEEEANRAASEMDEDEWTDRNFGASAAEGSSDDISDLSDSEEDDDDTEADFAEALTADETLRLAENWTRRHSHAHQLDDVLEKDEKSHDLGLKDDDESTSCQDSDDSNGRFSYQEYDSEDDESDTATEGEEELRARELRKKEVELRVPERQISDSGSDTEVNKNTTSSVDNVYNDNSISKINNDENIDDCNNKKSKEFFNSTSKDNFDGVSNNCTNDININNGIRSLFFSDKIDKSKEFQKSDRLLHVSGVSDNAVYVNKDNIRMVCDKSLTSTDKSKESLKHLLNKDNELLAAVKVTSTSYKIKNIDKTNHKEFDDLLPSNKKQESPKIKTKLIDSSSVSFDKTNNKQFDDLVPSFSNKKPESPKVSLKKFNTSVNKYDIAELPSRPPRIKAKLVDSCLINLDKTNNTNYNSRKAYLYNSRNNESLDINSKILNENNIFSEIAANKVNKKSPQVSSSDDKSIKIKATLYDTKVQCSKPVTVFRNSSYLSNIKNNDSKIVNEDKNLDSSIDKSNYLSSSKEIMNTKNYDGEIKRIKDTKMIDTKKLNDNLLAKKKENKKECIVM